MLTWPETDVIEYVFHNFRGLLMHLYVLLLFKKVYFLCKIYLNYVFHIVLP